MDNAERIVVLEEAVVAAAAAHDAALTALAEAVAAVAREAWPAAEWQAVAWNAGAWLPATSERWSNDVLLTREDGKWNVSVAADLDRLDGPVTESATADTLPDAMAAVLALLDEADADAVRAALGVS